MDSEMKNYIVRDGMVIDKNYMSEGLSDEIEAIGKHTNELELTLFLFPVPKNGPMAPMTLETYKIVKAKSTYNDDVFAFNCNST